MQLQVIVVVSRQLSSCGSTHLVLVLLHEVHIDSNLSGLKGRVLSELQFVVASELASKPQERLFELVVGLGTDFEVLKTLLAVELDGLYLNLTILDINLVTTKHDGDLLANANKITVPVGDVLVSHTRSDIEHDDGALTLDVVTITKTTETLLTCSIPHVETDRTAGSGEGERVDDNTNSGKILLLEFTSDVTLHEGGLAHTTITDKNALECCWIRSCHCFGEPKKNSFLQHTKKHNKKQKNTQPKKKKNKIPNKPTNQQLFNNNKVNLFI